MSMIEAGSTDSFSSGPSASETTEVADLQSTSKSLDACVICLEPVSERAIAVPCNHYSFDFICIISWLQDHPQCPLCKEALTAVEYDWRSPDDYRTFSVTELHASKRPLATRKSSQRGRMRRRADRFSGLQPYGSPNPFNVPPDVAVARRRNVYRRKLYSLHVGSNRVSQYKDFTPTTFQGSIALQDRAERWIKRELQVFDLLGPDVDSNIAGEGSSRSTRFAVQRRSENTEFLVAYIMSVLKSVDIKGSSGKAEELLGQFLGHENTKLFLHELNAWLRSPYSALQDWDRAVQYREDISTLQSGQRVRGQHDVP